MHDCNHENNVKINLDGIDHISLHSRLIVSLQKKATIKEYITKQIFFV